jgi:hypothetical protein
MRVKAIRRSGITYAVSRSGLDEFITVQSYDRRRLRRREQVIFYASCGGTTRAKTSPSMQ